MQLFNLACRRWHAKVKRDDAAPAPLLFLYYSNHPKLVEPLQRSKGIGVGLYVQMGDFAILMLTLLPGISCLP